MDTPPRMVRPTACQVKVVQDSWDEAVGLGYPQGPFGGFLMTRRRAMWITPRSLTLFLAEGVGNLRDPAVGNIMSLDILCS